MPTQADIARHWGVTEGRVSQLVAQGCPTKSLKAADAWKAARASKRAATNKKEPERRVKLIGKTSGMRQASKTNDSLLDALKNAIMVADGAFEEYEFARVNKLATRSARLSEHSKALEARLKCEKAYREEMERREVLVDKQSIIEQCRRCLDTVLRRLRKLPNEVGPQCNPQDSIAAVAVLSKAVNDIIETGRQALNDLGGVK